MAKFAITTVAWKWLVAVLALGAALLMAAEFSHGIRALAAGQQGSLGVLLSDQIGANRDGLGTHWLRIERLDADSPLLAAGAQTGQRLHFDRPLDRWRKLAPGETVGLRLDEGGAGRHLALRAGAEPIGFADAVDYWGRLLVALPALLFGLLVGFKQPAGRAYRCLALMFIALSTMFYYSFTYAAPGQLASVSKLVNLVMYSLVWYWVAGFALAYQPYRPSALRVVLRRIGPPYRALALANAAYAVVFGLGHEAPLLWLSTMVILSCGLALTLLSLFDGWRECDGEIRERHRWLLLSFAAGAIPGMLTVIAALDWSIAGARLTVLLHFVGQALMYAGLAYAVLRHRVFNFHFAVSRLVLFSVISILLLCSFGMVEWLLAPRLHEAVGNHDAAELRVLAEATLAVAVYTVFHQVHERIEQRVEHLFFRAWHENEQRLRLYVKQANRMSSTDALLASLLQALERFSAGAGVAVYLRQTGGGYTLAAATLAGAPPAFAINDAPVVALRSDLKALQAGAAQAALPGELVLPMWHRATLNGFVVLGTKPGGESYRPDEVTLLTFATCQIGLDLHARRVEALERAVRQLAGHTAQQERHLKSMAGRRRLATAAPGLIGAAPLGAGQ